MEQSDRLLAEPPGSAAYGSARIWAFACRLHEKESKELKGKRWTALTGFPKFPSLLVVVIDVALFVCLFVCLFVWVGLGWVGLGWVGLGWVGLVWFGLVCFFVCSLCFVWLFGLFGLVLSYLHAQLNQLHLQRNAVATPARSTRACPAPDAGTGCLYMAKASRVILSH